MHSCICIQYTFNDLALTNKSETKTEKSWKAIGNCPKKPLKAGAMWGPNNQTKKSIKRGQKIKSFSFLSLLIYALQDFGFNF